ncbi:MAG: hypothetical protein LBB24_00685 [Rickettsiales bacterium]|jgi:hypothetical protein|nr:hypothetical protein [Rickettsiales bacterium]
MKNVLYSVVVAMLLPFFGSTGTVSAGECSTYTARFRNGLGPVKLVISKDRVTLDGGVSASGMLKLRTKEYNGIKLEGEGIIVSAGASEKDVREALGVAFGSKIIDIEVESGNCDQDSFYGESERRQGQQINWNERLLHNAGAGIRW